MPVVKPFKGVLYNRTQAKDLARVVAPPYDIIPARTQRALYRSSPYNVIRLELGRAMKGDTPRKNRYTRARDFFASWLRRGVLAQDAREALYIYGQTYRFDGKTIDRLGFMGRMRLGGTGRHRVLPHENTLRAPKEDRLSLMREVNANVSPIFILYDDPSHRIARILRRASVERRPVIDLTADGVRHRVWRLDDAAAIARVGRTMRSAKTFIADGHHRFETAGTYAREARARRLSRAVRDGAQHIMVYFVETDEKMLTILPAHRLVRNAGTLTGDAALERLRPYFTVTAAGSLAAMMARLGAGAKGHLFGMYAGKNRFYLLRLKDPTSSDRASAGKPRAWRRLDVSILHRFIFQHLLGISDDDDNIEFAKDPRETAEAVDAGDFKIAFFLNPTKASEVKAIAKLGECMPRKATYFYPKPLTGLVIHKF